MRGVSPIVAVVLLIAISIIASVGVWYWVGTFTGKPVTPNVPGMMSIATLGNGKVLVTNLGDGPLNLTTLKTSDPHVWVTMCDKEVLEKSGDQAICDLLVNSGFNGSKTVLVYGNDTNTIALQVTPSNADASLVGWWSFDDIYYNGSVWIAPDDSGNGNNGVLYNGSNACTQSGSAPPSYCPQIVDGVRGKALEFDGVDDKVVIFNIPQNKPLTITLWTKTPNSSQNIPLLDTRYEWYNYGGCGIALVYYNSGYRVGLGDGTNSLWANSPGIENNTFNLVSTSLTSEYEYRYINTTLVGVSGISNIMDNFCPSAHDMSIGYGMGGYSQGTQDELMIFNRALNTNEINWLYKYGLSHQ